MVLHVGRAGAGLALMLMEVWCLGAPDDVRVGSPWTGRAVPDGEGALGGPNCRARTYVELRRKLIATLTATGNPRQFGLRVGPNDALVNNHLGAGTDNVQVKH